MFLLKEGLLTLLDLGEGETAAIHALHSEGVARRRIQALGLFEGRRVCVIARAPFSGPLLVEDVATNPRAVGLLYAGSTTTAIANPINEVLAFLGATMVGN